MKTLGYYNGKFGPLEEMTVPMNDRVCYFGDGVYEATLAKNGKIFALKEHLDRFFNSAGLLKIEIPYTKEEISDILSLEGNSLHCCTAGEDRTCVSPRDICL